MSKFFYTSCSAGSKQVNPDGETLNQVHIDTMCGHANALKSTISVVAQKLNLGMITHARCRRARNLMVLVTLSTCLAAVSGKSAENCLNETKPSARHKRVCRRLGEINQVDSCKTCEGTRVQIFHDGNWMSPVAYGNGPGKEDANIQNWQTTRKTMGWEGHKLMTGPKELVVIGTTLEDGVVPEGIANETASEVQDAAHEGDVAKTPESGDMRQCPSCKSTMTVKEAFKLGAVATGFVAGAGLAGWQLSSCAETAKLEGHDFDGVSWANGAAIGIGLFTLLVLAWFLFYKRGGGNGGSLRFAVIALGSTALSVVFGTTSMIVASSNAEAALGAAPMALSFLSLGALAVGMVFLALQIHLRFGFEDNMVQKVRLCAGVVGVCTTAGLAFTFMQVCNEGIMDVYDLDASSGVNGNNTMAICILLGVALVAIWLAIGVDQIKDDRRAQWGGLMSLGCFGGAITCVAMGLSGIGDYVEAGIDLSAGNKADYDNLGNYVFNSDGAGVLLFVALVLILVGIMIPIFNKCNKQ